MGVKQSEKTGQKICHAGTGSTRGPADRYGYERERNVIVSVFELWTRSVFSPERRRAEETVGGRSGNIKITQHEAASKAQKSQHMPSMPCSRPALKEIDGEEWGRERETRRTEKEGITERSK